MLVCEFWRGFVNFFYLGYGCEKHNNYKRFVFILIQGGLTFRV
jgi:hypothetical protein